MTELTPEERAVAAEMDTLRPALKKMFARLEEAGIDVNCFRYRKDFAGRLPAAFAVVAALLDFDAAIDATCQNIRIPAGGFLAITFPESMSAENFRRVREKLNDHGVKALVFSGNVRLASVGPAISAEKG